MRTVFFGRESERKSIFEIMAENITLIVFNMNVHECPRIIMNGLFEHEFS